MASLLLPGVADRPSTRNLHLSSRSFLTASTMSLFPLALWHSSTTRQTIFLCGQMPVEMHRHLVKQVALYQAPYPAQCRTALLI